MKIADVDFYLLDPTRGADERAQRTMLVRLATATGEHGWGELRTNWRPSELGPRRDNLLPILAGRNVADVEELLAMEEIGPSSLRAGIEMACWDLIARKARQPIARLWGGDYRPRVPLAVQLPAVAPEQAGQLARELAERGFATQTIVAVGDSEHDLAVVAAVREATADRVILRLDGSGRYTPEVAREVCRQLERAGLQFFLDPLATGLDGFAALARQTTLPLAVSAAIRNPGDVLAVARLGAAPHVVIDVALVGGLWPARKCAIVAAAAHIPASVRGAAGLGVSLAGVLQLAAATPNLAHAHECAFYQLQEDILVERPALVDGMMTAPQGPGLGVEVDRARIDTYLVT